MTEEIVLPIVYFNYKGGDFQADADDVLQETMLRVYKVLSITSDYDENILHFIGLVAKGKWRDQLRKRVIYQKHLDIFALNNKYKNNDDNDIDLQRQFKTIMQLTQEHLPNCYSLFVLQYEFGLTIPEIAEGLNTNVNNISVKLNYCRKRLLEKIKSSSNK